MTPNSRIQHRPTGVPIGTLSTVSDSAPRGIDMVIHGRSSSLMPSGVTTRDHTCLTGASTMHCRSKTLGWLAMALHAIGANGAAGSYVVVACDRWYQRSSRDGI